MTETIRLLSLLETCPPLTAAIGLPEAGQWEILQALFSQQKAILLRNLKYSHGLWERDWEWLLLHHPDSDPPVHPRDIPALVQGWRDHLAEHPGRKIVFSTFHPYVVDQMQPEEVLLVHRVAGVIQARRMSQFPEIEKWMENISLGVLWTMGGEVELWRRIAALH